MNLKSIQQDATLILKQTTATITPHVWASSTFAQYASYLSKTLRHNLDPLTTQLLKFTQETYQSFKPKLLNYWHIFLVLNKICFYVVMWVARWAIKNNCGILRNTRVLTTTQSPRLYPLPKKIPPPDQAPSSHTRNMPNTAAAPQPRHPNKKKIKRIQAFFEQCVFIIRTWLSILLDKTIWLISTFFGFTNTIVATVLITLRNILGLAFLTFLALSMAIKASKHPKSN